MRKLLTKLVFVLAAIPVFLLAGIFTGSMSPSEKVKSSRSQHDISNLSEGTFVIEEFGRSNAWDQKVLIIKAWDKKLYVHIIPTDNNLVPMPERYWGWGFYKCKNFGPDTDENGMLTKTGKIRCHDKEAPEWMATNQWVWQYSGKSEGTWVEDMDSPKYEIKGTILYING